MDVAGYRVLRTAARGSRCRLLVGHSDGDVVVLKVAARDDPAFPVEAEALDRAVGDHVVGLHDVATNDDDAVLVLDRLGGGTLGDLLERRGSLTAGEAVTLLAPVATTLDRMHAAGVAHGDLSLDAVCLSDDGAPTLVGFGRAELFAAEAPEVVREAVPGVVADRDALRGLVAIVLGRVAGARADAARRLAASLDGIPPAGIAAALFDLAVPEPVAASEPEEVVAWRAVEPRELAEQPEADDPALPGWLVALVPDPFRGRVDDLATRGRRMWAAWSPGRRRLVLGAVAGSAALALALVALPGEGESAVADPSPSVSPASLDAPTSDALPEDPVEAAVLLLEARARCLRDLSVLCLDDVDQSGSAAYDDDRALIALIESGGETPVGVVVAGELELVERLGDSALIALPTGSEPGSILLLRTDVGWRIRDYLPGQPAGSP